MIVYSYCTLSQEILTTKVIHIRNNKHFPFVYYRHVDNILRCVCLSTEQIFLRFVIFTTAARMDSTCEDVFQKDNCIFKIIREEFMVTRVDIFGRLAGLLVRRSKGKTLFTWGVPVSSKLRLGEDTKCLLSFLFLSFFLFYLSLFLYFFLSLFRILSMSFIVNIKGDMVDRSDFQLGHIRNATAILFIILPLCSVASTSEDLRAPFDTAQIKPVHVLHFMS